MEDTNEMYIAQEDRDPERLEGILRHSSRRQDATVTLVQLPNANPRPLNEGCPRSRASQRRATIVNTAGVPQGSFEEKLDPFEWYFHRNSPDLRTSLVREGTVDGLTSRRKSRIGGNEMEQMLLMLDSQNLNNKHTMSFQIQEHDNNEEIENKNSGKAKFRSKMEKHKDKYGGQRRSGERHDEGFHGNKKRSEKCEMEQLSGLETDDDEPIPVIDTIMNSLSRDKEITVMPSHSTFKDHESPFQDTIMNSLVSCSRVVPALPTESSLDNHRSSLKETMFNSMVIPNQEINVFPAEYSYTDQKSPFKDRDEIKPRPSSRVRVLIMLDEWDEDEGLEDENRRKRRAKGDGRRRGEDLSSARGNRTSGESSYDSDTSRGYKSDKRKDKSGRGRKRSDGDDEFDRKKYGQGSERGRKPGYRDDDRDGKGKGKLGGRPGDDDGKGKRGGRPGDQADDKRKYGDGRRPGERADDGFDDDGKGKRGGRPGDQAYDKRKYGDGRRPGERADEGFDDDGKGKRGGRPGDQAHDKGKYGDGRRPGAGERADGFDDDGKGKWGSQPGDRYGGPDERFYNDGRGGKDDREGNKREKDRPGGDNEVTKYRTVSMPKSATTLTSRRRYHLQVTDHDMKEPWFNSCFNISKENNVDFNYEGPVKITPYYVADKFS